MLYLQKVVKLHNFNQCTSKTYYSRIHKSQSIAFEDKLILVDSIDRKIGEATKEECHKLIDGRVPLHRAFSLFVFDSHDRLYMQKRSKFKHTFANTWSMTCCSHPLADYHPNNFEVDNGKDVAQASLERLKFEMGAESEEITVESLKFISRVRYSANSCKKWGENEIDYLFFARGNLKMNPNINEVSDIHMLDLNSLKDFNTKNRVSPWFKKISHQILPNYWSNLKKVFDHPINYPNDIIVL